jgi:hypothetical protein
MLYAVDQQASSSEMQQWVSFMINAAELLPPMHGMSGLRAHLCKVPPCSWRRVRLLPLSVFTFKPSPAWEAGSPVGCC